MRTFITLTVLVSISYGYSVEDKIRYEANEKIEWAKNHPKGYKASLKSRIAKFERERDQKIKRLHSKRDAKNKVSKIVKDQGIELFALKGKCKDLEEQLKDADRKFIAKTKKSDIQSLKKFTEDCSIPNIQVVEKGEFIICFLSKKDYIAELEKRLLSKTDENRSK